MLQIAICDDNVHDLNSLAQFIDQYRVQKHIDCNYTVFANGFDLIAALEKGRIFDLYCLDIIMPGYTGIEVAREIRTYDKTAAILFLTTSSEYALESYEVKSINYILKPVSKAKLFTIFDEIIDQIKNPKRDEVLIVKSDKGIQRILISNLVYAEVIGRKVLYHLLSGKVIQCTESFSSVCEHLLKYKCFVKPHRSFLVNMQYIDTSDNIQITLQTLTSVPIAQGKSREVKQQYLNYQLEGE